MYQTAGEMGTRIGGLMHSFLENGSKPELTIHDHQHLRSNAAHGQLTLAAARYIHLITIMRLYTCDRLCA